MNCFISLVLLCSFNISCKASGQTETDSSVSDYKYAQQATSSDVTASAIVSPEPSITTVSNETYLSDPSTQDKSPENDKGQPKEPSNPGPIPSFKTDQVVAPASSVNTSIPTNKSEASSTNGGFNLKKMILHFLYDPEKDEFSKMATLKTWVAGKYWSDYDFMKKIQEFVYENSFGNPDWLNSFTEIQNNPGDLRFFGKTFPSLWGIELPFLQFVNQQSKNKTVKTLEIAAGAGFVSWKVPFAFESEGSHLAVDLSKSMIFGPFQNTINKRLGGTNLKNKIQSKVCDVFDLLNECPELEGTFDAIYVQNLEHFFNPIKHQEFLQIISKLLAVGGKAFLSSHSHFYKTDVTENAYKVHAEQNQKNDPYSGFLTLNIEYKKIPEAGMKLSQVISQAERAQDNDETKLDVIENSNIDSIMVPILGNKLTLSKMVQKVTINYFSPLVYKNAIKLMGSSSGLKLNQSYILDKSGTRMKQWGENVLFACAIVDKVK